MPKETKKRYAINFDLKIEQLRQYYSSTNPKGAYGKITSFMKRNGFEHRQWSGYISKHTLSKSELIDFTMKLHKEFPWLINCEGSMDATVITSIFDIKQMILDTMTDDDEDMTV